MLYIYHGADDFTIVQTLEKIKGKLGDREALATNITNLDGGQLTVDQLKAVCDAMPFLAENRLVIVKGLLERFEPKRRTRGQTKITKKQDGHAELAKYITEIPDSTTLVLMDNEVKSGNPLLKLISRKAEVKSFPLLRGARLKQWIQKRVADEGGRITPQAVDQMANMVGSKLWVMSSEIEKLLLYASGRGIEEDDVRKVVSYAQEFSVFNLVDAVIDFRVQLAERLLQYLLQRGASPAQLLVMLTRQVRLIVRAREISRQGLAESEVRSRLGIPQDWVLRKTLEQARRYSVPRLKEVYSQLLETDMAIKTGKYDGELALNILIAELCQRDRVEIRS